MCIVVFIDDENPYNIIVKCKINSYIYNDSQSITTLITIYNKMANNREQFISYTSRQKPYITIKT